MFDLNKKCYLICLQNIASFDNLMQNTNNYMHIFIRIIIRIIEMQNTKNYWDQLFAPMMIQKYKGTQKIYI